MRRLFLALTPQILTAGAVFVGTPVAYADSSPPAVEVITISPDAVAVAGLDLVPVTVNVRLTDADGVVNGGGTAGDAEWPYLVLRKVGGSQEEGMELQRTSGTAQDGVWSAVIQVPSTWDGQWETKLVRAADDAQNMLDSDLPGTIRKTLTVTGTHLPRVTVEFEPEVSSGNDPVTFKGRFFYSDTGEGIGNQPIYLGFDNLCAEGSEPPNATTAADGTFSGRQLGGPFLHCAAILRPSNIASTFATIVAAFAFPAIKPEITIEASRSSAPVGSKITLSGSVEPAVDYRVEIQELRNGAWRGIGGVTASNGRYSFRVVLVSEGHHRYRAFIAETADGPASASREVLVAAVPGLPVTGTPLAPLVASAIGLTIAGIAAVVATRRRRPDGSV